MKLCKKCDTIKPLADFGVNNSKPDGLQSQCRECRKETNHAYYVASPEHNASRRAASERQKKLNREYVQSVLDASSCVDCGFKDNRALDFDHVRGEKTAHVSALVSGGYSIERIKVEIAMCEVRCANCHRIVTAQRRNGSMV